MLLFQILVKIKINEQDFSLESNNNAFQAIITGNDSRLSFMKLLKMLDHVGKHENVGVVLKSDNILC